MSCHFKSPIGTETERCTLDVAAEKSWAVLKPLCWGDARWAVSH